MFFDAFVGVHCVIIMNAVWEKRAKGLETRTGAVKIYPLYYFEINTCFFPGSNSNNNVTVIFRNICLIEAD